MISCIRASGTNQPFIDGVKDLLASTLLTALSAGITTTFVWHAQSSIKQSVDVSLITVGNRFVDLVDFFFRLSLFIAFDCDSTFQPKNNDRANDRDDRAGHACFFAMPREMVYPIEAKIDANSPSALSPPESGAITPDAYRMPINAAAVDIQNSVVLMPFFGCDFKPSSSILFFEFFVNSDADIHDRQRRQRDLER